MYYRWHPLFGQSVRVAIHAKISPENEVICQRSDGTRVVLPIWMLDPECSQFVLAQPFIPIEALLELVPRRRAIACGLR